MMVKIVGIQVSILNPRGGFEVIYRLRFFLGFFLSERGKISQYTMTGQCIVIYWMQSGIATILQPFFMTPHATEY